LVASSLEDLKRKLREEAESKARMIVSEALSEAEKIIKKAEEEWVKKAESERSKILEQAREEADRILSEARIKAKIILVEAKNNLLLNILNTVEKALADRNGVDVEKSLEKLLEEALNYVENPVRVIVDPRDAEIARELLKRKGLVNVEIKASDGILGGVIVESADGKRIDNSYKTRLENAKRIISRMLAEALRSTES